MATISGIDKIMYCNGNFSDVVKKDSGKVLKLCIHDFSYFKINTSLFYTAQKITFSIRDFFIFCAVFSAAY